MTAAADLIQDALEATRVYEPGETATDADYARGFTVLNRLVDAWAEESLAVTQIHPITLSFSTGNPLVSIQSPSYRPIGYVYGPGQGTVTITAVTTNLNIVSAAAFAAIASVPGTGTPTMAWPDVSQFPFPVVNLAPTPSANGTAIINALWPLTTFADVNITDYTLGTGVQDALRHNLALALKPYFPTAQLSPETMALAQETKNFLRYKNRPSRQLIARDRKAALPKQASPGEGAAV